MRLLRLLNLFGTTAAWYRDRLARIRSGHLVRWTVAEVTCMTLSLGSLVLLAVTLALRLADRVPPAWLVEWVLPLLLAGAVGYLTNLVAVAMLFRPYASEDRHPVGAIWYRGLVPRNKDELARTAGQQVASRLLTPEAITAEVRAFIEQAFEDPELKRNVRSILGPIVREQLPAIVDTLTPQVMQFLREVIATGFTRDNLRRLLDDVVEPWLRHGDNEERLVERTVATMQRHAPLFVEQLEELSNRYKQRGALKRFALSLAEATRALDWGEVRQAVDELISSRETRERIADFVSAEIERLRVPSASGDGPMVDQLTHRAADFIAEIVEEHLGDTLPELGNRLADTPSLWKWLAERGLPALQPYLLTWLTREGAEVIERRFDVAGRVESAILEMDTREMHEMINEVSARHLGAIQVLGFALGTVLGVGLLLA